MPKQVWQADDGSIHDSEEDCLNYETADKLLRLLFDGGYKKSVSDYEELEGHLYRALEGMDSQHPRAVARLLCLLHQQDDIKYVTNLTFLGRAMQELGAYLQKFE